MLYLYIDALEMGGRNYRASTQRYGKKSCKTNIFGDFADEIVN